MYGHQPARPRFHYLDASIFLLLAARTAPPTHVGQADPAARTAFFSRRGDYSLLFYFHRLARCGRHRCQNYLCSLSLFCRLSLLYISGGMFGSCYFISIVSRGWVEPLSKLPVLSFLAFGCHYSTYPLMCARRRRGTYQPEISLSLCFVASNADADSLRPLSYFGGYRFHFGFINCRDSHALLLKGFSFDFIIVLFFLSERC